jgi:tRNA A-37 threonylcarbamoyl transferase component Bud32
MTLSPDLTLADRYALEERIAVGGMGEVWRARDVVLDRRVAVKVLKEEYAADPKFLDRFRSEAKHTAALSHPGIASVFDYGEVGDMAFLVMEYVDGEPLSALLARAGRLPADRALDVVGQAALALQAAHDAGVVHRDVKPGNLIVRPDGVVKVTDFGIARAVDAVPVTQTGMVVGTAAYLSPEQAAGRPVTPASDVYALGVVSYECLAGERPFGGDSAVAIAMAHVSTPPPPLPKDTPPIVADLVTRALDKEPDKRPSSAGDFGRTALALAASLREPGGDTRLLTAAYPTAEPVPTAHTPTAPPPPPAGPSDRERRRLRNIFIGIGAAVVVLGFVLLHSCAGGAQQVTMPRVIGESFGRAATALHAIGLNATQRTIHDAHRSAGEVLAQSAPVGARLGAGHSVVLTVASGPRTETVNSSDYVGHPAPEVVAALRAKNLVVTTRTTATNDAPPGSVLSVTPSGSLHEGDPVTVTVAAAPPHHHGKGKDGHD